MHHVQLIICIQHSYVSKTTYYKDCTSDCHHFCIFRPKLHFHFLKEPLSNTILHFSRKISSCNWNQIISQSMSQWNFDTISLRTTNNWTFESIPGGWIRSPYTAVYDANTASLRSYTVKYGSYTCRILLETRPVFYDRIYTVPYTVCLRLKYDGRIWAYMAIF